MTNTVDRRTASGRGYSYGGPAFVGGILVGNGLGILLDDSGHGF
jgi:F0F1-type ATP synthase assembly protein I